MARSLPGRTNIVGIIYTLMTNDLADPSSSHRGRHVWNHWKRRMELISRPLGHNVIHV